MNRRAHVGTVLLVIGAFLLVVTSLFMMVSNNTDLTLIKSELRASSDFASASHDYLINDVKDIIGKSIGGSKGSIDFEKSFNESLKKLANEKRTSGLSNTLYAKLVLGDYSLLKIGENYEIVVLDVFENYDLNNNEVTYSYSLKVVFDSERVISIDKVYK